MITNILEHPELPGIHVYLFDDGTAVVSDSAGNESPAQPYKEEDFTSLGWVSTTDEQTELTNIARDMLLRAAESLPPRRKP